MRHRPMGEAAMTLPKNASKQVPEWRLRRAAKNPDRVPIQAANRHWERDMEWVARQWHEFYDNPDAEDEMVCGLCGGRGCGECE